MKFKRILAMPFALVADVATLKVPNMTLKPLSPKKQTIVERDLLALTMSRHTRDAGGYGVYHSHR